MIFVLLTSFILGLAVGSFLNVVIDRTVRDETIFGRSYCDYCKVTLLPLDLVPVLSFVFLRAKCRYCKKPLSWQYPLVELAAAILFTVAFFVLAAGGNLNPVNLFYWFFLISVMIVVAAIDVKFSLIPTTFVFCASLASLFYGYFTLPSALFAEHVFAAFGAALLFLLIVIVTQGKGMGQGDVVLAFLMGMVLGYQGTFVSVFLAFFTGAVISILLIILGKKKFGQTIPFAPFLVLGFLLGLFWWRQIVDWYMLMLY